MFALGPYSLSVRDFDEQRGPHVKHYKIRYSDPAIGYYIAARRTFSSLEELIDYYISKIENYDFNRQKISVLFLSFQKTLTVFVVN